MIYIDTTEIETHAVAEFRLIHCEISSISHRTEECKLILVKPLSCGLLSGKLRRKLNLLECHTHRGYLFLCLRFNKMADWRWIYVFKFRRQISVKNSGQFKDSLIQPEESVEA